MILEECASCNKVIREGEIRFVARISLMADDGGFIDEAEDPDFEIAQLLEQLGEMDAHVIENDVFEERAYILCAGCRSAFLKNPFGHRKRLLIDDDHIGPIQ